MTFVLVLAVTGTASADQLAITVLNAGFEDPVLAEDGYTWLDIPGWTPVGGEGPGIWHVTSADFEPVVAPEGQNVLYTENAVGDAGGVAQVLTDTFAANMDYTLTVEVGNSYYYYNAGYSVQLLAGGVVIAEDNDTLWPDYYKWATSTVEYTYDPADAALVGQPLEIRLLNLALDKDSPPAGDSVGVEFDNVTLSYLEVVQGPVYLWNGSAADGLWDTPANWTVTDSVWTWPNEEYGNRQVNSDTIWIDILNGDAVSRGSDLGIDGAADGSTTGVLTLNNGSSLTVAGALATSTDPGRRGQIDILGGSIVNVIGDGNDIRIADDPDTWGMLNIVDSTVDIADDLRLDEGEAYVNISGSSIINADGITAADAATGVSYLDISGTTTVTLVDDFKIDEGIGTITIGGDAVISFGDDCYLPDKENSVGTMTLTGNSVFNVGDDMTIADDAGTVGHVIVTGNATLNAPDELYLADANTASAILDVNGTATVNIGDDLNIGEDGPGTCNIGENATVDIVDDIYVGHNVEFGAFESYLTISGNASVTCQDLIVANNGGLTGYLHILGNPTIHTTANFYMNDDEGDPAYSQVIMDGGTVTVDGYTTFNDDNPGTAEFIMNGGSFYSADYLNLSDNLDGIAHLTMNGGEMITGNRLRLGKDGGEDTGQVRIFMNGGLLQAEELSSIKITDTQIIYKGGEFRIGSASLDEAGMQQLITDGTIVAEGAYSIVTDGAYTALVTKAASGPNPANGAEDVALDAILSWWPGFGAVSHDGYIGISSPPPFIGNTPEVTFDPGVIGGLQPNTTYYWQLNAVEADGTTHIGDIWSFTTMDPNLVAYYALENDVLDGSGNGNDGTIVGAPTFVDGPAGYGMAMEFHGLGAPGGGGDYINCGNDASLDIPGPISIALWIKPGADDPEGQGTETAPMAKAMSGISPWNWQVRYGWGSPQPYMAFTFNTSPRAWAYVGRNLERNEWCHIACSHDGATLKCYLDGVETDSTPMGEIAQGEAPVLIGSDGWGCDWIGAIDEVAIYNRALSEAEVLELASK